MWIDNQGDVSVARLRKIQQTLQVDLPRRGVKHVRAANDIGDSLPRVVGHDGELVGKESVGAEQHKIAHIALQILRESAGGLGYQRRVTATTQAYFDFVSDPESAFRLVFESDLTSEPSVRARVERVLQECAELVSNVIAEDAGLSAEESHLLAVGLIGSAQISARYWVTTGEAVSKDDAVQLVSTLAWRGISRFPRAGG